MNILVTGCNGQLGNEMQLLEKMNPQYTYFNTDVQELDITDQGAIERFVDENAIDGIVNCAAYTAVDKAEDNQALCRLLLARRESAAAVGDGVFPAVCGHERRSRCRERHNRCKPMP